MEADLGVQRCEGVRRRLQLLQGIAAVLLQAARVRWLPPKRPTWEQHGHVQQSVQPGAMRSPAEEQDSCIGCATRNMLQERETCGALHEQYCPLLQAHLLVKHDCTGSFIHLKCLPLGCVHGGCGDLGIGELEHAIVGEAELGEVAGVQPHRLVPLAPRRLDEARQEDVRRRNCREIAADSIHIRE